MVKKWQKVVDKTPNRKQIQKTIENILGGNLIGLDIVPLGGRKNYYRCRVGDFRIIFMKDTQNKNLILSAGYRGDIYKNM